MSVNLDKAKLDYLREKYEVAIGLEVHAELSTKTKIFCSCTTEFGGSPNTHCCPICMGMPGTLPVLNKKVVEYGMKAGYATNCKILNFTKQDRKNYFYPDLPKGYQISQYDLPICREGYVEIDVQGRRKKIRITRIHIEEDAGKLVHDELTHRTIADYNRAGVPLIEIVTEPDLSSAEETIIFLEKLKSILQFIDVSDCKMQEGSLRADVNISIRPKGSKNLGTRTETKNLNSFKSISRAIEAEIMRQIMEVENGREIIQETRRWDDEKGVSYSMRSKEEEHDYRYFPEPDLPPVIFNEVWMERVKSSVPELPEARKKKYMKKYNLPEYDADILTSSRELSDFFEEAIGEKSRTADRKTEGRGESKTGKYENNIAEVATTVNVKAISNWIMGDLLRILKDRNIEISDVTFSPKYLAKLVTMIDKGVINANTGKKVFEKMFDSGKDPEIIVKEECLEIITDESYLLEIVKKVVEQNPKSVADYKNGKEKSFSFLMGQLMKETKGKADPQLARKYLIDVINTL
ncbi:MAG TPA: Asp-tRNA(Asn)/Glu-tRNA(Gln) amidotransferase subunit GatB [Clostridiaceae bacterium]|nr:Asp-tRNA(Asn)/Glu-tRNA(Gln) amidotransferase subunit GatB [Clostridiaceae bacterium]